MAGNFNSPFKNSCYQLHKKFQWYIYEQPLLNAVVYDATLQGGVFDHKSPYTIPVKDISRLTFR